MPEVIVRTIAAANRDRLPLAVLAGVGINVPGNPNDELRVHCGDGRGGSVFSQSRVQVAVLKPRFAVRKKTT